MRRPSRQASRRPDAWVVAEKERLAQQLAELQARRLAAAEPSDTRGPDAPHDPCLRPKPGQL